MHRHKAVPPPSSRAVRIKLAHVPEGLVGCAGTGGHNTQLTAHVVGAEVAVGKTRIGAVDTSGNRTRVVVPIRCTGPADPIIECHDVTTWSIRSPLIAEVVNNTHALALRREVGRCFVAIKGRGVVRAMVVYVVDAPGSVHAAARTSRVGH